MSVPNKNASPFFIDKGKTKQVNEIIPNLYLTSVYGATRENVIERNIKVVINSAHELPKIEYDGVYTHKIDLHDKRDENIQIYFDSISDYIHQNLITNRPVMVHCVMGISRSVTLVIAYLIKYHKISLLDSLNMVKSKRSIIRPNSGFINQLKAYEQMIKYNSYLSNSPTTNSYFSYQTPQNNNSTNNAIYSSHQNANTHYNNGYYTTINNRSVNPELLGTFNDGFKHSFSSPSLYKSPTPDRNNHSSNNSILHSSQSSDNMIPNNYGNMTSSSSPLQISQPLTSFKQLTPHPPPFIEVHTQEVPDWYTNKEYVAAN